MKEPKTPDEEPKEPSTPGEEPQAPKTPDKGPPQDIDARLNAPTRLKGNHLTLQGKLPENVGKFKIQRIIGEGGMGVVGLGVEMDGHAEKRKVAVKFIKRDVKGGSFEARIFDQECKSLSRFNHDNIARLFDFGYHEGNLRLPYIVMEYVEKARVITDYCDREAQGDKTGPLPLRRRLELFLRVCDGIRHAHERNVIHRDISAKNVLVGEVDEKAVVKIIDFGLSLHNEDKELGEGGAAGTPAYMSPEQLKGDPAQVDQRSDVYALGILLCEVMVGRKPYDFQTTEEAITALDALSTSGSKNTTRVVPSQLARELSTLAAKGSTAVSDQRLGLWRRLVRELRGDLDAIVAKATALDPDDRYPSVAELAEDIERHLTGYPLAHAIKPSTAAVAIKYLKRNAVGATATAALAVLAISFVTYIVHNYRKSLVREAALKESKDSLEVRNRMLDEQNGRLWQAQQKSYSSALATYPVLLNQGKLGEARAVLASTRDSLDRGWEWFHLLGASDQSEMVLGHSTKGFTLAIDAGPSFCAVAGDHSVWFWESKKGEFIRAGTNHRTAVLDCASDGQYCYTVDARGNLISWEAKSGKPKGEAELETAGGNAQEGDFVLEVAINAKTGKVAARWQAGEEGRLGVFDLKSGKLLCAPVPVPAQACLCWRDDGSLQTAGYHGQDGEGSTIYRTWQLPDAPTEALTVVWESPLSTGDDDADVCPAEMISRGGKEFLRFSPQGVVLATWTKVGQGQEKVEKLMFSDALIGEYESLAVLGNGSGGVVSKKDGGIYGFVCEKESLQMREDGSRKAIGRIVGHTGPVASMAFAGREDVQMVSASKDGTVRVWNAQCPRRSRLLSLRAGLIERLTRMDQEERTSALVDLIRQSSSGTGWCRTIEEGGTQAILAVFDAPPWILRTGCGDTQMDTCTVSKEWKTPPFLRIDGQDDKVLQGPRIVGAGASRSGALIAVLRFNPVTNQLQIVAGDQMIDGTQSWTSPPFGTPEFERLAVSDDGRWIVTNRLVSKNAEEAVAWDFKDGVDKPREVKLDTGGQSLGMITAVEFSTTGGWLAVGNSQGQMLLWQMSGAEPKLVPAGKVTFPSGIRSIAFSHQADKIAVSLADDPEGTRTFVPRGITFVTLSPEGVPGTIETPNAPRDLGKLTQDICWNRVGTRLASADTDGRLRVWAFRKGMGDQDVSLGDCRLVLELDDAHRDDVAGPLRNVCWSSDGRWLAASNADEGCYVYYGAEDDEDWPRRRVRLELDDMSNRVSSIAQLRTLAGIKELKDLHMDTAVTEALDRIGVHPGEMIRWAWTSLVRMRQLTAEELTVGRKGERDQYLSKLEQDALTSKDPGQHLAIALARYRLNSFDLAKSALDKARPLTKADSGERGVCDLLEALILAAQGKGLTKAKELLGKGQKGWQGDVLIDTDLLWQELAEIVGRSGQETAGR